MLLLVMLVFRLVSVSSRVKSATKYKPPSIVRCHERVKYAANQLVQIIKASAVSYYGESTAQPCRDRSFPTSHGGISLGPLMAAPMDGGLYLVADFTLLLLTSRLLIEKPTSPITTFLSNLIHLLACKRSG